MPIYEYQCQTCENIVETWQGLSEPPLTDCPKCDGQLKKLISMSSFQLKGGGWYADGYSNSKEKSKKSAENAATKPTKSDKPASCPKKENSTCAGCQ